MSTPELIARLRQFDGATCSEAAFALEKQARQIAEDEVLIARLLAHVEQQTCTHEETHRAGVIWEICDACGAKWADDEGGKPAFRWPAVVEQACARLTPSTTAPRS